MYLLSFTMFRLSTFRQNPNDEVSTLVRATKAEMLTLVNEYHFTAPHGPTKTDLHNLILDHLLDNDAVTPESHEHYLTADKNALAAIKLKLELANAERERLKEQAAFEKETLQRKECEVTLEREREKEALQLQKDLAALQREQIEFQREQEREQLELKECELEIQREHDKKQAASALDHRKKELDLETTLHTRRQQAEAKLPVELQ
ncbi:fibrinogen- and Ig-binding protein-like isoform X2 [Procambarus clarkii]|uniref:fibrinogen- and Ig-binding protein-like isoform X2 n=1 Tax=Procambarus clarkii TaxID=6728 RepID=UPI0037430839